MSMYNMLFGVNPWASFILQCVDLSPQECGRIRDAFVAAGEVVIYTRNGGSNRDCADLGTVDSNSHRCNCYGCAITYRLPMHPLYLRDLDDPFDCTYASIYFRIPEACRDGLESIDIGSWNPAKRWTKALGRLKEVDPELLRRMQPLTDQLREAFEKLK